MPYTISENCTGCGACARICPASAISGEKKAVHRIDPEKCIDCGACGRVCPKGGIQDNLGQPCTAMKRSEWPRPRIDNQTCMSCNICIDACPVGCLALSGASGKDPNGHPYLADEKKCIACGYCANECPVMAIRMAVPEPAPAQVPVQV